MLEKMINAAFKGRNSLSREQFHHAYFKDCGTPIALVSDVISILETELGTDLSRIQAEDDFSGNLRFLFAFDDMVDVSIVWALEGHFMVSITDVEAKAMCTVRDIVNVIRSKSCVPLRS